MPGAYEADRLDTSNLWYSLFQKGVELGTWNVESLFEEVGFEEDREVWRSLDDDEREQVRRLLAGFLDGEHEVGQDAAHHLQRIMSADCLEHTETKEMYMTMFTLSEHKHTQFVDVYMNEVVGSDVSAEDKYTELDPRRRGSRVPVVEATGLGEVFERQGRLAAKAAHTHDPVDIARLATNYHLNVEGVLARTGFYAINSMTKNAPLPLLNKGFKFISTDEGRHIAHGINLLKELIEKEREGVPEYQGVSRAIVETLHEDAPRMGEFGYMITDSVDDPLDIGFDNVLLRAGELIDGMYNESLGLDINHAEIVREVGDRHSSLLEADLDSRIEEYRDLYRRKSGVAADGSGGSGGGG
ncbi:MAG: ribonucleotide-diphosphate reductase subunit beta [Halobacteria archaeon]|nr:ribonucleotide-diphosphate reductase subunit beta [Halobacteria archaeon]